MKKTLGSLVMALGLGLGGCQLPPENVVVGQRQDSSVTRIDGSVIEDSQGENNNAVYIQPVFVDSVPSYPDAGLADAYRSDIKRMPADQSVADAFRNDAVRPHPDAYRNDVKRSFPDMGIDQLTPDTWAVDSYVADQKVSLSCPVNMIMVNSTTAFCIDMWDHTAPKKTDGVTECANRGVNGKICDVDSIDLAIQYANIMPTNNLATAEGTGCCCPCGGYQGSPQQFWIPVGGMHGFTRGMCECWWENRPEAGDTYFRCCTEPGKLNSE